MCGGAPDIPTIEYFGCLFEGIISALLGVVGIAFFIMFISAGFKYLTSSGDPKALQAASTTLTHAVLGLVAAALGYMVLVIVQNITGANVTNFVIYNP
jgi:hypothetical protein